MITVVSILDIIDAFLYWAQRLVWTAIGSIAIAVIFLLLVALYFNTLWPRDR